MSYEVLFSRSAAKFIKRLNDHTKDKVREAVEKLRENPFPIPYKKIKGMRNTYRIRMGNYRILYEVHDNLNQIWILKVGKRENVYD